MENTQNEVIPNADDSFVKIKNDSLWSNLTLLTSILINIVLVVAFMRAPLIQKLQILMHKIKETPKKKAENTLTKSEQEPLLLQTQVKTTLLRSLQTPLVRPLQTPLLRPLQRPLLGPIQSQYPVQQDKQGEKPLFTFY